jgi:hypothetical protein
MNGGVPDLTLRLGLATLLLNPGLRWPERTALSALALAGLLVPALARRPVLWLLASLAMAARLASHWPRSDNHDYLLALTCLAFACALATREPRVALATSARLLVGLAFALATLWKGVLSPDFANGDFFRTALLLDGRFESLALVAGGMTPELFLRNEAVLDAWAAGQAVGLRLAEPVALVRLARALAVWTLLVEGAVALGFLWPGRGGPARLRDAALVLFCATTYAIATVATFGWLLVTLGVAATEPDRTLTRRVYLATFFLILLYHGLPLSDWLRLAAS